MSPQGVFMKVLVGATVLYRGRVSSARTQPLDCVLRLPSLYTVTLLKTLALRLSLSACYASYVTVLSRHSQSLLPLP